MLLGGVIFYANITNAETLPDTTPLSNLGEAILHIKSDILILSNTTRVIFKNGSVIPYSTEADYPICSIEIRQPSRKIRILKAGLRDISLTGETGNDVCHYGACWIHLLAAPIDLTIHSILCAEPMDRGQQITLKTLKTAVGNYMTIEIPPPGHGLNIFERAPQGHTTQSD